MNKRHRKTIEEKIKTGFHRVRYEEMRDLDLLEKICGYARVIIADKDNKNYSAYCSLINKDCKSIFKKSYNCEEYKKIFE